MSWERSQIKAKMFKTMFHVVLISSLLILSPVRTIHEQVYQPIGDIGELISHLPQDRKDVLFRVHMACLELLRVWEQVYYGGKSIRIHDYILFDDEPLPPKIIQAMETYRNTLGTKDRKELRDMYDELISNVPNRLRKNLETNRINSLICALFDIDDNIDTDRYRSPMFMLNAHLFYYSRII